MIVTFSYPLPDELFVEGVSGNVTGTYTYNGPKTFDVHLDSFGLIDDINVNNDPPLGVDYRKTIDASKNPEVAYLLQHYFVDDYTYEHETEDEILENGDVYKKILNPDLKDAYYPRFNFETNKWELTLIVKDQTNPSVLEANRRKEYIESYSSKYSFGSELDLQIKNYLEELEEFISNQSPIKLWKYTNINLSEVPKIPYNIVIELDKISKGGL